MSGAAVLLDSTLREGELFRVLREEVRVGIGLRLVEAGISRIELTVDYPPRTSSRDVKAVVDSLKGSGATIVMHGRAYPDDIQAIAKYDVNGCALYLSPTKLHRDYKLHGISYDQAIDRLVAALELAKQHGFSYIRATLEDASRLSVEEGVSGLEVLRNAIRRLKQAGATIVSVPDTAGLMAPRASAAFFRALKRFSELPLAAHFHNDYGFASANTVEAALEGADELHVTVMGVGDRNGIADLYEVAAGLEDGHGISTGVDRPALVRLYRYFSRVTGIRIPWRHPLSEEARTIRAGVHQSMTLRKPEGYMPAKKLSLDLVEPIYELGPYVSSKLIAALLNREKIDEVKLERILEALAASSRGSQVSPKEFRDIVKREAGVEVDPQSLAKFLRPERVYILIKLMPQYPVHEMLRRLWEWDEVESVDEVYGEVDMVVKAQLTQDKENIVARIKQDFSDAIDEIRVLVAD